MSPQRSADRSVMCALLFFSLFMSTGRTLLAQPNPATAAARNKSIIEASFNCVE
jgi:hypothetical protein